MYISHRAKLILAFGIIYVVWGTTFFAVQVSLKSFSPFLLSSLRLLIAGSALAIFCIVTKEAMPTGAEIVKHIVSGQIIFIGGIVAFVWAQQFISSSLASTIITTPFWFVVLDRKQWKFYFSNKWIPLGLLVGLAGVILLMTFKTGEDGSESALWQMMAIGVIVTGSFMWASGSLYVKYNPSVSSVYVTTTVQMLSAGITTIVISYFAGEFATFNLSAIQPDAFITLVYLSLVSSLLGFLSFIWLIKVQPPAIVSTYSYVNPLVATVIGWAFAHEEVSAMQLLALALILTGLLFVNIPRYFARPN